MSTRHSEVSRVTITKGEHKCALRGRTCRSAKSTVNLKTDKPMKSKIGARDSANSAAECAYSHP